MTNPDHTAREGEWVLGLNLTGQRFGDLTALTMHRVNGKRHWVCLCDCGVTTRVSTSNLRSGSILSCGCRKRRGAPIHSLKHGHNRGGKRSKEYRAWAHLIGRCTNPTDAAWDSYGGRGVSVCERWRTSFEAFLADMGPAPSKTHSVDRENPNGNYAPDNCRWATPAQQARNTRRTIRIDGRPLKDVCEERGLKFTTVYARVWRGMTPEEAVNV